MAVIKRGRAGGREGEREGGREGGRRETKEQGLREREEKHELHGNQDDRQIASMTWFAKTN